MAIKLIKILFLLFGFWICLYQSVSAQQDASYIESEVDAAEQKKDNYFAGLPVIFFLPETGLAFGGLGIYTYKMPGDAELLRTSSINLALVYTLKNQLLLFLGFDLFAKENKIRIKGELGYYRYLYNFYGRGENSLEEDLEPYKVNFPRFEIQVTHKINDKIAVGPSFKTDYYSIQEIESGGLVEQQAFYQKGLKKVTQLGITGIYDTRDFVISPSGGSYVELAYNHSVEGLLSDVGYKQLLFRGQWFKTVKKDHILALASYVGYGSESTPFYKRYYVGTSSRGRGVQDRRFQDTNILNILAEYRFQVMGKWGGVLFAGGSNLNNNFNDVIAFPSIWNAGLGLRYRLSMDQRVRVRLDTGFSEGGVAFYLTLNDAF